jgi:hypothetical protein
MALIAIVALLGGVPYALWAWGGGAPWPSSAPSGDWLTDSLGAEQILGILVAVLWLAWAHFAICVVVEAVQSRRAGSRQVPGGGVGTQSLARRLVASAMLLVGSAAVAMPTASAATGPGSQHTAVASTYNSSGGESTQVSHQAGQQAGGPERAVKQQATKPAELKPGLAVRTPQGVKYEVQPPANRQYDCLWDIAERYLNDGLRWKEIYQLNKDVVQPDGNSLEDPDLIYPGWILQLPDDAEGPGVITLRAGNGDTKQMDDHTEQKVQADDGDDQHLLIRGDHNHQRAAGGGGVASAADDASEWAAPLGVGGGLVAASLLFALRRRRGWQGGGPGGDGGLKPGDEANLRLAADGPAALLVDRSMRQLSHSSYQAGRAVPPVRAAYVNEQSLTIAFETPAVMAIPDGWRSSPDGRVWTVDRAVADGFDPPAGVGSPCPTLATVGRTSDDTIVLANFAAARGVVALTGATQTAHEIAMSVALELASAPWADALQLTLVGFHDNLADLAPHRIRHAGDVDSALAVHDHAHLGVVLAAHPPSVEQEKRLAAAIGQGQLTAAVVVGDVPSAAWRLEATPDGRLTNAQLGLDVAAQRVPTTAAARMVELFRWADAGRSAPPTRVAPQPVPGFDPRLLEPGAKSAVLVQLLGPVKVTAPGEIETTRVELATEIVAHLALHPAGVHPSVLASAIWPRGVSDEVFEASLGHVRRWLGAGADGHERLFQDDQQRWRLDLRHVRVDWQVLRAFVARAERADDPTMDLASALSCVEGPALDELPPHRYSWLANTSALRDIQTTVVGVALRVSSVAADAANLGLAHESLRTGLDMVPGCEELWRAELRLTHRTDSAEALRRVADEMFAAIERHGSPRGAEAQTVALVEELLPGYGRVPAGKIA